MTSDCGRKRAFNRILSACNAFAFVPERTVQRRMSPSFTRCRIFGNRAPMLPSNKAPKKTPLRSRQASRWPGRCFLMIIQTSVSFISVTLLFQYCLPGSATSAEDFTLYGYNSLLITICQYFPALQSIYLSMFLSSHPEPTPVLRLLAP